MADEPPFISGMVTGGSPVHGPRFKSTAEWLRWRADRLGPFGLDYISAAELRAIADELEAGKPDAR